jgi:hypothetical protein
MMGQMWGRWREAAETGGFLRVFGGVHLRHGAS